jgi:hypothetical protein
LAITVLIKQGFPRQYLYHAICRRSRRQGQTPAHYTVIAKQVLFFVLPLPKWDIQSQAPLSIAITPQH